MSTNVEQAEVEAILAAEDEIRTAETVGELDFNRPRRLSTEHTGQFQLKLERGLTAFVNYLGESFPQTPIFEIKDVREAVADDLHSTLDEGFVAVEFKADDQIAWVVTDALFSARIVNVLLGGDGTGTEAKAPSPTEKRIVSRFLAQGLGQLLVPMGGVEPEVELKSDVRGLLGWRDAGPAGDPYRVVAEVELTIAETATNFTLWLPGGLVGQSARDLNGALQQGVPRHLVPVDLSVSVELEGCEITLDELLSLEVGDVIPLDAKLGDPVRVTLDGRTIAHGVMGQHQGQVAARLIAATSPESPVADGQEQN